MGYPPKPGHGAVLQSGVPLAAKPSSPGTKFGRERDLAHPNPRFLHELGGARLGQVTLGSSSLLSSETNPSFWGGLLRQLITTPAQFK